MTHNKEVGIKGEKLAKEYLERKGYKIVDLNIKLSYREIDIIAVDHSTLVFAEVKTRTNFLFGGAEDAIDNKKIEYLKRAASMYLGRNKKYMNDFRFDFIAVDINLHDNKANIKHYIDIV